MLGIEIAANGHGAAARPQSAFNVRILLPVGKAPPCKDALLTIWAQSFHYPAG